MILEVCILFLTIGFLALIYYVIQVLQTLNRSFQLMNETIDKTKETMDETNAILKNTNQLTKNAGEITSLVKNNAQSIDNVLMAFKKMGSVMDRVKRKK